MIFHALIMSKITYTLPAFAGHISTAERNRINKFFRKANRQHLVTQIFDIDTLIETTDSRLFRSITYPDDCLNYMLSSKRSYTMQLRPKAHNFTLPHIHTTLFKNSFINRCIFGIVWLHIWLQSVSYHVHPPCIVSELTLDIVFFIFTFVFIFVYCVLQCDCHCFLPRDASAERGCEIACRLSVCL